MTDQEALNYVRPAAPIAPPPPVHPPEPPLAQHLMFAKEGWPEGSDYEMVEEVAYIHREGRSANIVRTFKRLSDGTQWSITTTGIVDILHDTLSDIVKVRSLPVHPA